MFQLTEATSFVETWTGHCLNDNRILFEVLRADSNSRLAMLGDKALGLALIDNWRVTGESKGTATRILQGVASNANLGEVASRAGLEPHVVANPGHLGPILHRTLATAVEAILGALWVDSGKDIQAIKDAMTNMGLTPKD